MEQHKSDNKYTDNGKPQKPGEHTKSSGQYIEKYGVAVSPTGTGRVSVSQGTVAKPTKTT